MHMCDKGQLVWVEKIVHLCNVHDSEHHIPVCKSVNQPTDMLTSDL